MENKYREREICEVELSYGAWIRAGGEDWASLRSPLDWTDTSVDRQSVKQSREQLRSGSPLKPQRKILTTQGSFQGNIAMCGWAGESVDLKVNGILQ